MKNLVDSPCVRNCCLDEEDICLGCFRSLEEIVQWSASSEEVRRAVLAQCDLRKEQRHRKTFRFNSDGTPKQPS